MERVAPAARTDRSIRSAAFQGFHDVDEDFETSSFGWDLMRERPSSVEAIRSDITALRERMAQAAPRRVVVEMDRAIELLSRKVEDLRAAGDAARVQDNAAVEAELLKLKAALEQTRAPERFQALAAGIDALTRKLDALSARSVDPVEIARLQRQTDEMKELAARALEPGGLRDIATRIAACAMKMDRRAEELTRRMGEATSAFERSTETLLTKVQAFESSVVLGGHANAEELRREVTGEVKSINARLDQMMEKIAGLSPAASSAFAQRLDALLARIESVGDVDRAAVAPLTAAVEKYLTRLTDRVRDTQTRLDRLDTIEASLARILSELDRVREAAVSAPVEAANAVAKKVSEDPEGPAVVGLKRGLAALEARQDHLERRTGLIDEIEGELQEITADLGRADHDDNLWMPRGAGAPKAGRRPEPASAEARAEARGPHMAQPGAKSAHHAAHPAAGESMAHGAPHGMAQGAAQGAPQGAAHAAAHAAAHGTAGGTSQGAFKDMFQGVFSGAFKDTVDDALRSAPLGAEPKPAATAKPAAAKPASKPASPADGEPAPQEPRSQEAKSQEAKSQEAKSQEAKSRPRRVRLDPEPDLRAHRAEPEVPAADVDWPHGSRRVDWTVGRHGVRKDRKITAGKRYGRRQALLLMLLAGAAAALLMTTAAGLAFQQKPELFSGVGAAFGRLQAQGASLFSFLSPVRDLPTPVGPEPLRSAALSGNVAAAYAVGVRYAEGLGTKVDARAAEKWLAYAVAEGSAPAAYRLGSLYEYTARDLKEAKRFYEWAAEQGNVRAMHNLGVIYSQGIEGKPDWEKAVRWFRKSAEMGQTDSQYNLGVIYARGLGGNADPAEAWKWFALAASQGDADSASKRDALIERSDPAALARAREDAEHFKALPYDMAANTVTLRPEWEMNPPEALAGKATASTKRAL